MEVKDRGAILSTLWIFVTLNYLYCDVLSLMSPELLNSLITTGGAGGITMSEPTLLGAAIILEISILLVLLSRVLKHKANRLVNIIGGSIKTFVVAGTLFMGASLHYIFFAIIEIASTSFIVWFAWTWTESEAVESRETSEVPKTA